MGFVNDLYDNNESYDAVFETYTVTNVNGNVDETWATSLETKVIFFEGAIANAVISERLRARVDGTILMDYEDYTTEVKDEDRVTVNGTLYYVIHTSDIALQHEVIQILVERRKINVVAEEE